MLTGINLVLNPFICYFNRKWSTVFHFFFFLFSEVKQQEIEELRMQLTKSEEASKKLEGNIWNVYLKQIESFFETMENDVIIFPYQEN